ncbi:MAG: S1C family serine protease [Flavobacteriales bacterium]
MLKTIVIVVQLFFISLGVAAQLGMSCETPGAKISSIQGVDLQNPIKKKTMNEVAVISAEGYFTDYYFLEDMKGVKKFPPLTAMKSEHLKGIQLQLNSVKLDLKKEVTTFKYYKGLKDFRANKPASDKGINEVLTEDLMREDEKLLLFGNGHMLNLGLNDTVETSFFSFAKPALNIEIIFTQYRGGITPIKGVKYHEFAGYISVIAHSGKEIGKIPFESDALPTDGAFFFRGAFDDETLELDYFDWNSIIQRVMRVLLTSDFWEKNRNEIESELGKKAKSRYEPLPIISTSSSNKSINEVVECVVTLRSKSGHGSGCIISDDGLLVTNYHVAYGSKDSLFAVMSTGEKYPVEFIRDDVNSDLALLKIVADRKFNSLKLVEHPVPQLGQDLRVVGTPANVALGQTITKGIFSSERKVNGMRIFQTDAHVNPGNSGGALIDEEGKLIGVVALKAVGFVVEGVGFAISTEDVVEKLNLEIN